MEEDPIFELTFCALHYPPLLFHEVSLDMAWLQDWSIPLTMGPGCSLNGRKLSPETGLLHMERIGQVPQR